MEHIGAKLQTDFEGLTQAARKARLECNLSAKVYRDLEHLDICYNVLRHISSQKFRTFESQLLNALNGHRVTTLTKTDGSNATSGPSEVVQPKSHDSQVPNVAGGSTRSLDFDNLDRWLFDSPTFADASTQVGSYCAAVDAFHMPVESSFAGNFFTGDILVDTIETQTHISFPPNFVLCECTPCLPPVHDLSDQVETPTIDADFQAEDSEAHLQSSANKESPIVEATTVDAVQSEYTGKGKGVIPNAIIPPLAKAHTPKAHADLRTPQEFSRGIDDMVQRGLILAAALDQRALDRKRNRG